MASLVDYMDVRRTHPEEGGMSWEVGLGSIVFTEKISAMKGRK